MALRLSFSTGTLYHLPLRTTFALAREAGLQGIELVYCPEVAVRGARYVAQLSREYSLPVLSVHPSVIPYPGYNRAARILPRLVSLAEALDCPLVVLHTPKVSTLDEPAGAEFLQTLLQERERCNPVVYIALENAGYYQSSDARFALHDPHRLRALADRYDLPLTLDTSHAGTSPQGVLGTYGLLRDRVVNVHFSDLLPRRLVPDWKPLYTFLSHHQMPGQGVLPLSDFVRALLADSYAGVFTFEISPTAIGAWRLSQVRQSLRQALEFISQLEPATK